MNSKLLTSPFPIEQGPRMLKDFLTDNSHSCPYVDLNATYLNKTSSKLLRSRSKAASMTISTMQKASQIAINAVKFLPFASIKPPSFLPRSISRKLSNSKQKKSRNVHVEEADLITVKVKDILRWRSFRDMVRDEPPPLDFSSSPHHCTTTTTTTGSTSTATGSGRSSWCDSDFTVEDLPLWCSDSYEYAGENAVGRGKFFLSLDGVGRDSMTVDPEKECPCEEKEQQSPVSVLDFSFEEDEESFSSFHQTPTYMEPKKRQKNRLSVNENTSCEDETNGVEEKAKQLLNLAKSTSSVESSESINVDIVLLDFFMHELNVNKKQEGDKFDCELLRVAKAWMCGEDNGCLEWKMVGKREISVRDMERGVRWNKFEEEEEDLGLEMENVVLNYLVDELLVDILYN